MRYGEIVIEINGVSVLALFDAFCTKSDRTVPTGTAHELSSCVMRVLKCKSHSPFNNRSEQCKVAIGLPVFRVSMGPR